MELNNKLASDQNGMDIYLVKSNYRRIFNKLMGMYHDYIDQGSDESEAMVSKVLNQEEYNILIFGLRSQLLFPNTGQKFISSFGYMADDLESNAEAIAATFGVMVQEETAYQMQMRFGI